MPAAGQVGLGEHDERAGGDAEALLDRAAHDGDDARLRRFGQPVLGEGGGDLGVGELLDRAPGGAGAGHDEHGGAAGGGVRAQVGEGAGDVAAVALDRADVELDDVVAGRGELAQRPPRVAGVAGVARDLGEVAVGGAAEVERAVAAARGRHPRGLEELLAGADEVVGAGADLLRVDHQHVGAVGQDVGEQVELARAEDGDQRLHALGRDAVGELGEHLGEVRVGGVRLGQRPGAVLDLVGEQQLAARRRGQLGDLRLVALERTLVGDGELADLGDLVAPELDADGVLGGGHEDVEDAAADGELAALLDHVDAGVGEADEALDELVEVVLGADGEVDRGESAQAGRHGLDEAAHGGDDDLRRGAAREPVQDLEPLRDGVRAGRESLVRQRLPGREVGDRVAAEEVARGRR